MSLRSLVLASLATVAVGAPASAAAVALPPTPTVPLEVPPLPAPPAVPVPAPSPAPVPPPPVAPPPVAPVPAAPVPAAPVPAAPVPAAPVPAAAAPAAAAETVAGAASPTSGTGPSAASSSSTARASKATAPPPRRLARKRPAIAVTFRSDRAGRVALRVTQVAPACRRVGVLRVRAAAGANRIQFDGRVGRKRLPDGTYRLKMPSGAVLPFAIVDGVPRRNPRFLAGSVCRDDDGATGVEASSFAATGGPDTARGAAAGASSAGADDADDSTAAGSDRRGPARVLGVIEDAAEAAASLHPAFYLLLALAIALLATATIPAARVPTAGAAAVLARRRAEVTLAGIVSVIVVMVGYLVTIG